MVDADQTQWLRSAAEPAPTGCCFAFTVSATMEMCGRPIHRAPAGVDATPVCLMHSRDESKQNGALLEAFWLEFHRILHAAEGGVAVFAGFVFPAMGDVMVGRRVGPRCSFFAATFTQDAEFANAYFEEEVDFTTAVFKQHAGFSEAHFAKRASFSVAIFEQKALFTIAHFDGAAEFTGARFLASAVFAESHFESDTQFDAATFAGTAEFVDVHLAQVADFSDASFEREAGFTRTSFGGYVDFSGVVYRQAASFIRTRFAATAIWRRARFLDAAEFRDVKFALPTSEEPSAVFTLPTFLCHPGLSMTSWICLGRCSTTAT